MDEVTLRRAQQGDSAAFESLVTPHEQLIWRLCWRYTRQEADAQDCVQETMLKAWRQLPRFRGECSLESWLYRVCVSCCLDWVRKRGRRMEESADGLAEEGFEIADPAPRPEERVISREERAALRRDIDQLPAPMRETLILHALEGRSYEETAALTGASMGTVKSRLNRARQKLIEKIRLRREQSGAPLVQPSERRAP